MTRVTFFERKEAYVGSKLILGCLAVCSKNGFMLELDWRQKPQGIWAVQTTWPTLHVSPTHIRERHRPNSGRSSRPTPLRQSTLRESGPSFRRHESRERGRQDAEEKTLDLLEDGVQVRTSENSREYSNAHTRHPRVPSVRARDLPKVFRKGDRRPKTEKDALSQRKAESRGTDSA